MLFFVCKKMQTVVLLEFFNLPDFSQYKNVICVTQRAYERVLSALYGNEYPEQIVTELLYTDVLVFRNTDLPPFDFTQVPLDGEHTLRDFLPPVPIDIVVQDIQNLTSFVHSDTYVYTQPNGDTYSSHSNIIPGDSNILSFLEFVRCLYARMYTYTHSPKVVPQKSRTLYVRGGGQHGTIGWGAVSAVLRHTTTPFEYFAGDSFGSAIAVMCALDKEGTVLFFDRLIDTCHRMQLDERNRSLDRDAAIEFICTSLHDYIDRTLADLNLPVDILVTNLARGAEHAVLNRHTAPNMKLKDALVASMSIPIIIGEHSGYFDGCLTAWDYVDRLGDDSVVVGLTTSNITLHALSMFGSSGSAITGMIHMWQQLTGQNDVLHSYKPYRQFCVPTRDPNVSVLGGMIGTTSWHILNFQFGFDAVSALF